jgi:hypothetical protein
MSVKKPHTLKSLRRRKFRVGDRAQYATPTSRTKVELIEDRGRLGVGGKRIWRIRTISEYPEDERMFEVREEELKPVRSVSRVNGRT